MQTVYFASAVTNMMQSFPTVFSMKSSAHFTWDRVTWSRQTMTPSSSMTSPPQKRLHRESQQAASSSRSVSFQQRLHFYLDHWIGNETFSGHMLRHILWLVLNWTENLNCNISVLRRKEILSYILKLFLFHMCLVLWIHWFVAALCSARSALSLDQTHGEGFCIQSHFQCRTKMPTLKTSACATPQESCMCQAWVWWSLLKCVCMCGCHTCSRWLRFIYVQKSSNKKS